MVVYIFQKVASADDKEAKPIHVPVRRRPLRGDYAEYFASTDKGYITNELWDSVVGHFLNTITPVMNGAEGLFLLDRHISHYTPRILRKLLENRIHSLFLPAHMTHFMQPLDDAVFGSFKLAEGKAERNETFFRIATGQQLDDLAPTAVYKAAKESFTPEVIVASWKRTGMWPADFDLIPRELPKT
jgi:hypothetical protein